MSKEALLGQTGELNLDANKELLKTILESEILQRFVSQEIFLVIQTENHQQSYATGVTTEDLFNSTVNELGADMT